MSFPNNAFPGASGGFAPPPPQFGGFPEPAWGQPFSQPQQSQSSFGNAPHPTPYAAPSSTFPTPTPFGASSQTGFGAPSSSFNQPQSNQFNSFGSGFGSNPSLNASQPPSGLMGGAVEPMWGQPLGNSAPQSNFGGNGGFSNTWSSVSNNAILGAATSGLASSLFNDAQETTRTFVHNYLGSLRPYFAVSNQYVIHSLLKTLVPFIEIKGGAAREPNSPTTSFSNGGSSSPGPGHSKMPSVDLYVPLMALITFVLLSSIAKGQSGDFAPEMMGTTLTICCFCAALDVCVGKLGLYLFSVYGVNPLDLLAAASGKFTLLSVVSILAILGPSIMYWPVFLYALAAGAFHSYSQFASACRRSKARNSEGDWGAAAFTASATANNQTIVGGILTALQVLYLWFLAPRSHY